MSAAEALLNCGVIFLLICLVCFMVIAPAMRDAKMDPDRDREER
jgi:hypothetical protein